MQIVIDITEEARNDLFDIANNGLDVSESLENIMIMAIVNGTPLPKGHGDLMILSKDKLKEYLMDLSFSCQKWISEVNLSFATVAIIEADKEE